MAGSSAGLVSNLRQLALSLKGGRGFEEASSLSFLLRYPLTWHCMATNVVTFSTGSCCFCSPGGQKLALQIPPCSIEGTGSCTLPDMHACHADVHMPAEAHQRACQTDLDSSTLLQGWAHMRRRGTLRVANLGKMRAASGLARLHSGFEKAGNCRWNTSALTDVLQHIDTLRPQYKCMQ